MTELKCPFCQQDLDTEKYFIHCHNPHCDKTVDMEGNEDLWQALIDAKKKLEYAGMILKNILPHLNGYEKLDVQKAIKKINQEETK